MGVCEKKKAGVQMMAKAVALIPAGKLPWAGYPKNLK